MISLQLESTDFENIRFAFSPLVEAVTSYRILHKPEAYPEYRPWIDEARRALLGVEFPYMDAVILPHRYIVDFLTPTPTTTRSSFEDELKRVRSVSNDVIRKNVQFTINYDGLTEIRQQFLTYPRETLECLIDELRLYWQYTLSHHWPHIRSILEGDMLFRARQMALEGVEVMIAGVSDKVRYEQGVIQLLKDPCAFHPSSYQLGGRGLQLVPAVFEFHHVSWQVAPEWLPMIIYGARGTGLWYREELPDPEETLTLTLGAGKAKVLLALQQPSHTVELAQKLSVTAGAISQQLGRLNQAGLVESHRSSNRVYYRLTARGEKLVALFTE
jgi:DNA-binding HxlR family transcriptional regulator